jgi:hypothetical protein
MRFCSIEEIHCFVHTQSFAAQSSLQKGRVSKRGVNISGPPCISKLTEILTQFTFSNFFMTWRYACSTYFKTIIVE